MNKKFKMKKQIEKNKVMTKFWTWASIGKIKKIIKRHLRN